MVDEYYLMHGNVKALRFGYDNKVRCFDVLEQNHLPYKLRCDITENDISRWISDRLIPVTREGYENIVKVLKAEESEEKRKIVLDNNALSLSDGYWIKKEDDEITWEQINYFDNDFNDELAVLFLESMRNVKSKVKLTKTPTLMLDGQMPKAWVIGNGKRILLKRSIGGCRNVVNELLASKLLDSINMVDGIDVPHIQYKCVEYGGKLCCACECFCSSEIELITAEDWTIEDKDSKNIKQALRYFINKCESSGIKNVDEQIDYMLTFDYIVGNIDRHWKNFGVMRNIKTLEITGLAPIYDNDKSFCYDSDDSYMFAGETLNDIINVVNRNRILDIEDFDYVIKDIADVDTKGEYDIGELHETLWRRHKVLGTVVKG